MVARIFTYGISFIKFHFSPDIFHHIWQQVQPSPLVLSSPQPENFKFQPQLFYFVSSSEKKSDGHAGHSMKQEINLFLQKVKKQHVTLVLPCLNNLPRHIEEADSLHYSNLMLNYTWMCKFSYRFDSMYIWL